MSWIVRLLFAVLGLASVTAFADDAIVDLRTKLNDSDRAVSIAAFKALEKIAANRARFGKQSELARTAIETHQKHCRRFLSKVGNPVDVKPESFEALLITDKPILLSDMRNFHFIQQPEFLGVAAPHFHDEHLKYFDDVQSLTWIDLDHTAVTGSSLRGLMPKRLCSLRLRGCPVDQNKLLGIEFPKLEALDVSETSATNTLIERLQAPNLNSVYLDGTMIDSEGLNALARFKKLEFLRVDLCTLTQQSLTNTVNRIQTLRVVSVACKESERAKAEKLRAAIRKGCELEVCILDK